MKFYLLSFQFYKLKKILVDSYRNSNTYSTVNVFCLFRLSIASTITIVNSRFIVFIYCIVLYTEREWRDSYLMFYVLFSSKSNKRYIDILKLDVCWYENVYKTNINIWDKAHVIKIKIFLEISNAGGNLLISGKSEVTICCPNNISAAMGNCPVFPYLYRPLIIIVNVNLFDLRKINWHPSIFNFRLLH